jgi:Uma2 family endonuclease
MALRKRAASFENLAELVERLGEVPLDRIRMRPPPGTARERDVLAALGEPRKRLCELVEGTLVEKTSSLLKSLLEGVLICKIGNSTRGQNLGVLVAATGPLRLRPGLVRMPDVAYIRWADIPGEQVTDAAIAPYIPALVVEVLCPGNTPGELRRKLRDYFEAGTRLMWVIEPKGQRAEVYSSPDECHRVGKTGRLNGGDVLPGFTLKMTDLFADVPPRRRKGA